jgi:hypothetical protein
MSGDVYPLMIDEIYNTNAQFKGKFANKRCVGFLGTGKITFKGHIGRQTVQAVDLQLKLQFNKLRSDETDLYDFYYNNIPAFIASTLNDDSETINDLWTFLYSKPYEFPINFVPEKSIKRGESFQLYINMIIKLQYSINTIYV